MLTKHLCALASLALLFIAASPIASAEQPAFAGTDGGVWVATFTPNTQSANCVPLSSSPPISSCDLPWSNIHARNGIISWPCCGGNAGMLLPAVRDWGGPIVVDASSPRLLISDFAGRGTTINGNKQLVLSLVAAVAVADPSATASQGRIPTRAFGYLEFSVMISRNPDGSLGGPFTYALLDNNGKLLFQDAGTLSMFAFPGFNGGVNR